MNDNFNMEAFIEKRLLEIENLEERGETREILTHVFKELHKYTEMRFLQMEQNFVEELRKQEEEYVIYTGISSHKTFDITEGSMFPIVEEDLKENMISTKDLREAFKAGIELKVFTVFFELDYKEIRKLTTQKRSFNGYIYTVNGEYPVTAYIQVAERYQMVIRELFKTMIQNGMPWKNMCMAYISKFFDVCLLATEIPDDEYITKIEIDFQEYAQMTKYHYFPTWNIEKVYAVSEVKKIAVVDVVQYQHYFSKKYIKNDFYLIKDVKNLISRSDKDDEIVITTDVPNSCKWELLAIKKNVKQLSEYPLLGNKTEGTKGWSSRTIGDIHRVVKAMGYDERLNLKSVVLPKEYKSHDVLYDMNYEILQGYHHNKDMQPMVLQFEKKSEDFLQMDIMNYIVGSVQRQYPEYICYGEYVKTE